MTDMTGEFWVGSLTFSNVSTGFFLRRVFLSGHVPFDGGGDLEQGDQGRDPQRILVLQDPGHGGPSHHNICHSDFASRSGLHFSLLEIWFDYFITIWLLFVKT